MGRITFRDPFGTEPRADRRFAKSVERGGWLFVFGAVTVLALGPRSHFEPVWIGVGVVCSLGGAFLCRRWARSIRTRVEHVENARAERERAESSGEDAGGRPGAYPPGS